MELVFATGNDNKIREVKALLPAGILLKNLRDIGCNSDLPETQDTIEGNAEQKASFIFDKKGVNCFAEDTGLEVDALDGAPGVYSARYAGPGKDASANMQKLLRELEGESGRSAQFKTVVALIINGEVHRFEGIVRGSIIHEPRGDKGFGYDPVFQPEGYEQTFSELGDIVKNKISHRARAMRKMIDFLKQTTIQP